MKYVYTITKTACTLMIQIQCSDYCITPRAPPQEGSHIYIGQHVHVSISRSSHNKTEKTEQDEGEASDQLPEGANEEVGETKKPSEGIRRNQKAPTRRLATKKPSEGTRRNQKAPTRRLATKKPPPRRLAHRTRARTRGFQPSERT